MFDKREATTHLLELLGRLTGKSTLTASTDLIESAVLDSLTMMDLVAGIDTKYGIRLAVQDLTPRNFQSITTIVETVATKLES